MYTQRPGFLYVYKWLFIFVRNFHVIIYVLLEMFVWFFVIGRPTMNFDIFNDFFNFFTTELVYRYIKNSININEIVKINF